MTIDEARQLFAYSKWANSLMFGAAGLLSPEEFGAAAPSSFPSVSATLAHLVFGEWAWLQRWLGRSPTAAPGWVSRRALRDLKIQLDEVEVERGALLQRLTDADLDQPLTYQNLSGQAFTNRLGDLMRHVVNHSTYHRGQLATQLRQLGKTPPGTDLILFLRNVQ
jgi:uncharacterized damage-inducible protein DinB